MSQTPASDVRSTTDAHRATVLGDLAVRLRVPSVSAQPEQAAGVRRSAGRLAAELTETGLPTAEVRPTDGAAAAYPQRPAEHVQGPTVLVHGHHDVQPAAREDGWDNDLAGRTADRAGRGARHTGKAVPHAQSPPYPVPSSRTYR